MKIDGIEGLRVSIRKGGSDLQEYDDATDKLDDPTNAVKYVEASSGSIFKIEGIIPRSPSPQPGIPLEERDLATLSAEEARELIRILRERQGGRNQVKDEIKHEGFKRAKSQMAAEVGDDDLMVTGEGRCSKRTRGATDEVVDCIDLTDT
ncbi:hypothetical protein KC330_g6890 [Hortaea werneckii]|nr:hypothetical protein KC330_g6890 [Hortaea werneckii]